MDESRSAMKTARQITARTIVSFRRGRGPGMIRCRERDMICLGNYADRDCGEYLLYQNAMTVAKRRYYGDRVTVLIDNIW
jgi:hypothetical protein